VILRLALSVLLANVFLLNARAATQVGTITASGAFKLRGSPVPASMAQSLALISGDEVETDLATAIVLLSDGSRITVDRNSRLIVQRDHDKTVVCLEQGAIEFSAAAGSRLTVCALGHPVQVAASSAGTVSLEGADTVRATAKTGSVHEEANQTCGCEGPKPWLTRKRAIVLVGTAGAAATAISIAVTRPPSPPARSPSTP
jgi:ferric-dicitrate binding protein FerR (iron transport regulator)